MKPEVKALAREAKAGRFPGMNKEDLR